MSGRTGQRGRISIKAILILLVIALLVYLGVLIAPVYIERAKLNERLKVIATDARVMKVPAAIRAAIRAEIATLGLTVADEAIEITVSEESSEVELQVSYDRVVRFVPFGFQKTFSFYLVVTEATLR